MPCLTREIHGPSGAVHPRRFPRNTYFFGLCALYTSACVTLDKILMTNNKNSQFNWTER